MDTAVGSSALRAGFIALTLALGVSFVAAVYVSSRRSGIGRETVLRRSALAAALTAVWIAVTGIAASRGVLRSRWRRAARR